MYTPTSSILKYDRPRVRETWKWIKYERWKWSCTRYRFTCLPDARRLFCKLKSISLFSLLRPTISVRFVPLMQSIWSNKTSRQAIIMNFFIWFKRKMKKMQLGHPARCVKTIFLSFKNCDLETALSWHRVDRFTQNAPIKFSFFSSYAVTVTPNEKKTAKDYIHSVWSPSKKRDISFDAFQTVPSVWFR